jgi:PTS system mannose-specific IIC component
MGITVAQSIVITFFCLLSSLTFPFLGDIGGYFMLGRPLIAGTIVGIIMGDIQTGMIIGATINAIYMGSQASGNVMSTDVTLAGYVATALAMATKQDASVALALSIPIGLLGSTVWSAYNALCVFFMHKCDTYAKEGRVNNIWSVGVGIPFIIATIARIVPCFLFIYYGSKYSATFTALMPEWLTKSMGVVGGMLPAVGMALLLKAMITKANYWCFFLIGFLAYKVIGITAVPLTILAVCLALILDRAKGKSDQTTKTGGDTLESLE